MFQVVQKKLKDQKGLTLIELLAVIVILAIIAAIAIPSILGLINNSKKDAQAANAQQMVNAARSAVAANDSIVNFTTNGGVTTATVTLGQLTNAGYLENPKNPEDKNDYDTTNSLVLITKSGTTLTYSVTLKSSTLGKTYFNGIDSNNLDRNHVATN